MTPESQKSRFYRFFAEKKTQKLIFDNYFNIHMKFEVHSTNIFGQGAKVNIARWQPPPLLLTLTA